MSEPTSNGNGSPAADTPPPKRSSRQRKQQARRDYHDAVIALEEIRTRDLHRLIEHYQRWDDDWSSSDLWDRTRGDYYHTMPSRPGDRRGGADWPLWRNETDLDRIRQKARIICEVNSYAKGFTENYVNHVVGKGCQYKVVSKEGTPDADTSEPGQQNAKALASYIARCQDEVDRFLKSNRWNGVVDPRGPLVFTGSREREIVARVLCDGEALLRFHTVNDRLVVRFIEPEQLRNPAGGVFADGWSFGIRHKVERGENGEPVNDVETTEAYYVYWIDPGAVSLVGKNDFSGEEVPVDEVLHAKGPNTKSTVKRGISFFSFDVAASFERARILQRNLSIGAAVRAAIGEHWEHATGTEAEVRGYADGQREGYVERTTDEGKSQTENYERRYPGMIRHTPPSIKQVFPTGQDSTPAYMQGVQGDLQQAVSGKCAPLYWAADTSGGTYAGLKEAGAPAVKMAEAQQTYFTAVFARVVWKALEVAVEAGRLEDRLDLLDLQVEAPTVLQRDRLQVAQESQILNMLGALSPQTICMEAGRDYEVEAPNIEKHQDRFGQMGTPLGMPGADGQLPGMPAGPKIPDTHGMGDDAGGALHDDKTLSTQQAAAPQADVLQGQQGGNDLRTTVGGLNAVASLQSQFYAGKLPREAAISNVMLLFGFTPAEAASLFPEIAPQKLTPDDAPAEPEGGVLATDPFPESVLEANRDSDGVRAARAKVQQALKDGTLKQGKCAGCGAADTHAHHDDYRKPLEVTWLCRECHDKKHGKTVPEAAGTCKPGERADLTGCVPATAQHATAPTAKHADAPTAKHATAPVAKHVPGNEKAPKAKPVDAPKAKKADLPRGQKVSAPKAQPVKPAAQTEPAKLGPTKAADKPPEKVAAAKDKARPDQKPKGPEKEKPPEKKTDKPPTSAGGGNGLQAATGLLQRLGSAGGGQQQSGGSSGGGASSGGTSGSGGQDQLTPALMAQAKQVEAAAKKQYAALQQKHGERAQQVLGAATSLMAKFGPRAVPVGLARLVVATKGGKA